MLPDSALTRCPECQTVFAVDGEDLARAGGRVRCGECLGVFDAIANALPADETPEVESTTDTAADTEPESANAIVDEPAEHAETASSLSWTLLEPVGDETDPAELTGDDAPDDESSASGTEALPTQVADELTAEVMHEPADAPASENNSPEPPLAAVSNDGDDQRDTTPAVTAEKSVETSPPAEFRFGDDTPPEALEAELEALLDDERDHTTGQTLTEEPEFDLTTTMSDVGDADLFDNDWDDLLGELDDTAESVAMTLIDDDSAEAPPLDFELADSDRTGSTSSVDLDLSRADAALAAPESIDAVTLTTDTGYRDAPVFDVFEPEQGAFDNDEGTDASDEQEIDAGAEAEPESASASADDIATAPSDPDADLTAAESEGIKLAVDAGLPITTQDEQPTDNEPAQSGESATATTPADPAVADADVEARLAAYHAALAAVGDASPAGSPTPSEDDAAFDVNALTDMFSAADILAQGAAEEAEQKAEDTQKPDKATESATQTASLDEDSSQSTEESGRSEDEQSEQSKIEAPEEEKSDSEDDLAATDAANEQAADDPAEDNVESNNSSHTDKKSAGEVDADALSAAMDAAEQEGEVIVLSGDPSELEPASDAFAESMILSADLAPAPKSRRLWLGLSVAALVALGFQTIHSYRGEIATLQPWGGYLSGAYAVFGQTVTPHWNATQMCVERSGGALNSDNRLDIETVFSNHGEKTMPMPILKLRITDAYSDTLAGVVIQPDQYLPATDPRTELRPGEQATALATLDYAEPRLDGFEVSLCYPGDDGALRCAVRCEDDDAKR